MAPRRKQERSSRCSKKIRKEENSKEIVDETEDNEEEGDITSSNKGSECTQSSTNKRGRTQMHCLAMQRVQGIREEVEFNHLGQPIGKVGTQLQSFIGVLAREKVKITYETWRSVPDSVREDIWQSVNVRIPIFY